MKNCNFLATLTLLLIFSFLPTFGQTSEIDHGFKKVGQTRLKVAEEQLQDMLMDIEKYEGDIKRKVSKDIYELPHVSEYLYTLKQKIDFFYEQKKDWNEQLAIYKLTTSSNFSDTELYSKLEAILLGKEIILPISHSQEVINYFIGYFGREIKIDLYVSDLRIFQISFTVALILFIALLTKTNGPYKKAMPNTFGYALVAFLIFAMFTFLLSVHL